MRSSQVLGYTCNTCGGTATDIAAASIANLGGVSLARNGERGITASLEQSHRKPLAFLSQGFGAREQSPDVMNLLRR